MKGYYSKKIQQSKLYKELQSNLKGYYEYSLEKEQKQQSYLNRQKFVNAKTGEFQEHNYSFEKSFKEQAKITEQRVMTIETMAKRKGYASVFLTLTLPSHYHPFKSIKTTKGRLYVSENENFAFDTLQESISQGYQKLNTIYKTFYKRIKNHIKNELMYVKVVENNSSTMLPHIHVVLYFPLDFMDAVRGTFKRVVEHFNLSSVDFDSVQLKDNLSSAGRYLIKYITKDLKSGVDFFKIRVLDGWKRFHKIRVLSNSQLPLNVLLYRKIYHSISFSQKNKINFKKECKISTVKEKIDKKVATLGIPLYLFIQDNLFLEQEIKYLDQDGSKTKRTVKGQRNSLFKVQLKVSRYRNGNRLSYKIDDLRIKYNNKEIYRKEQYMKLQV